jgi:uncharacterized protein
MKCPICGIELKMADRQGIEVDYCPQCRGVWLDRGEIDKIIERSASAYPRNAREEHRPERMQQQPPVHPVHHEEHPQRYGHKKHRRGTILEELFDFD